jgi:hypothetical protein
MSNCQLSNCHTQTPHFIARCHFSIKFQQSNHHAHESGLFFRNVRTLSLQVYQHNRQPPLTVIKTRCAAPEALRYNQDEWQAGSMRQFAPLTGTNNFVTINLLHRTVQSAIFTNKHAQYHYKLLHGSVPEAVQARTQKTGQYRHLNC